MRFNISKRIQKYLISFVHVADLNRFFQIFFKFFWRMSDQLFLYRVYTFVVIFYLLTVLKNQWKILFIHFCFMKIEEKSEWWSQMENRAVNVIKRTNVWTEIHRSSFAIVTNWIVFRFKGIKRPVRLETCEPPAAGDANILKHQRQTDSTSPVIWLQRCVHACGHSDALHACACVSPPHPARKRKERSPFKSKHLYTYALN